jgi:hypothetical protein
MTQNDIDNRRRYIKELVDKGEKLDYKALAERFGCSTGIIQAEKRLIMRGGGAGISFIYTLSDETGVRYVGQATNPFSRRLGHISRARSYCQLSISKWIRSLLKKGKKPIMQIIDRCPRKEADSKEYDWIRYYEHLGCDLINERGTFYRGLNK